MNVGTFRASEGLPPFPEGGAQVTLWARDGVISAANLSADVFTILESREIGLRTQDGRCIVDFETWLLSVGVGLARDRSAAAAFDALSTLALSFATVVYMATDGVPIDEITVKVRT